MEQNDLSTTYTTVACKEYYDYRTRNTLSLTQRVEVIREYERHKPRPTIKSLAEKFNCSTKQIKNILFDRESILNSFNSKESALFESDTGALKTYAKLRENGLRKRQEKINFLGKVMYEYIQRVMYHNYNIYDEKVRAKAVEIKDCMGLDNFEPTYAWLRDFKTTYGITAFDLDTLRNNVIIIEAKRPTLTAIDLIQYVSRAELEEKNRSEEREGGLSIPKVDVNDKAASAHNQNDRNTPINEPKIVYEDDDDDEIDDDELRKLHLPDDKVNHDNSTPQNFKNPIKRKANSPFPFIETVDDALRHVKCLEEYALLQNNYRVMGLLTQVEKYLKTK